MLSAPRSSFKVENLKIENISDKKQVI